MKQILLFFLLANVTVGYTQDFVLDQNFGNYSAPSYLAFDNNGTDYFTKVISNDTDIIYYVGRTASPLKVTVTSTTADGSLNPAFGGDYTKFFQVPSLTGTNPYNSAGEFIAFQGEKLIIAARFNIPGENVTALSILRLNADGTLDTTFGTDGYYIYAPIGIDTFIGDLVVDDTNAIFIGGRYRVGNNSNFQYMLQKLTPNGILDTTFSGDGILLFESFPNTSWISAIECLDNNQIMVAGTEAAQQLHLINSDGTLDNLFATIASSTSVEIKDIQPVSDGFLAAGVNRNNLNPTIFKFDLTGFDISFGNSGIAESTLAASMEDAFITDTGTIYFANNGSGAHNIFKTETGNGAVPFDTDNFKMYTNTYNFTVIYGLTQLTNSSIIGAGSGLNLINENTTGSDMYAIRLTESSLSLPELKALNFDVFPNPANDTLFFRNSLNGHLSIYTPDGKLILTKPIANENSLQIAQLKKGLYLMEVKTSKGIAFKKFIKN